jgi:hypothetical protein
LRPSLRPQRIGYDKTTKERPWFGEIIEQTRDVNGSEEECDKLNQRRVGSTIRETYAKIGSRRREYEILEGK